MQHVLRPPVNFTSGAAISFRWNLDLANETDEIKAKMFKIYLVVVVVVSKFQKILNQLNYIFNFIKKLYNKFYKNFESIELNFIKFYWISLPWLEQDNWWWFYFSYLILYTSANTNLSANHTTAFHVAIH